MEDWVANPNVFQSYDSDEVDDVGNDEDEEDDPDDEEYKYDVDADTLDTDMREAFPQGRTIKSLQRLKQYIYFLFVLCIIKNSFYRCYNAAHIIPTYSSNH